MKILNRTNEKGLMKNEDNKKNTILFQQQKKRKQKWVDFLAVELHREGSATSRAPPFS